MKISMSKFYREVTNTSTVNKHTIVPALIRWGVPYDDTEAKRDCIDIVHLETAKKLWASEQAAKALAREKAPRPPVKANGELPVAHAYADDAALKANTKALRDVEAAIMLLIEHLAALAPHANGGSAS